MSTPKPELPTLDTHSPEAIEREWLRTRYRGDQVRQLTPRALLLGALLGGLTGVSNLYVGLKTGWSVGVVITASVVGWAIWSVLLRVRLARTPMTILELNAMASTASAAGYSTGTNLVAAIGAYIMVVGHHMPFWQLSIWVLAVAMLGLFMAIPMKRQLVNIEQLPFPTGRAAAETLVSLHAAGDEGRRRANAMFWGLGAGVLVKWITAGMAALGSSFAVPELLPTPGMVAAVPALAVGLAYTWALEVSGLLVAAGVIMGWRVCWSLMLGAVICFGVVAPRAHEAGVIATLGFRGIVQFTLWGGVSLMVVSSMLLFVGRWRTVWRTVSAIGGSMGRGDGGDEVGAVEVPGSWFLAGVVVAGAACVWLQWAAFEIPVPFGIGAVFLAFVLAVVAARVTGETDVTPTGPLGKIAQLASSGLMPGAAVPSLMAASVTAGAAASAADLLTDLKSGHILGANPRKQFLAQAVGVLVGVAVAVPVFRYVLVPTPEALGTQQWPAPAAVVWKSVAQLLSQGLAGLPPAAAQAMLWGAAAGAVLAGLEIALPRLKRFIPSPTGLGLAFVLPAFNSLSFFVGGVVALWITRRGPPAAAGSLIPVAAGVIAGESLMGVVVALLQT